MFQRKQTVGWIYWFGDINERQNRSLGKNNIENLIGLSQQIKYWQIKQ